ncbi:nicotinamide mononucleotide adenylyltransferase [Acrasis kona]|uniref:Nicotinamide mononucleotide adenylyltransferase n=1 Tax=Acrasis kona TaxID=1008807 RepID=A0AAW2ZEL8_9EUKA
MDLIRTILFYAKSTFYCYILYYINRSYDNISPYLPENLQRKDELIPESIIPLQKIDDNIKKIIQEENENGSRLYDILYVLVSTGSYSPIHKMHTEMLKVTAEFLERLPKCKVVGGYLSPCHDEYVSFKLQDNAINAQHRINMCELAVKDTDWMCVDKWEINGPRLRMFSEVVIKLSEFLSQGLYKESHPDVYNNRDRIRVCFVCGSDIVMGYPYGLAFSDKIDVACVCRPSFVLKNMESRVKYNKKRGVNLYFVVDSVEDHSSTKVRECIKKIEKGEGYEKNLKSGLARFCDDNIADYMVRNITTLHSNVDSNNI